MERRILGKTGLEVSILGFGGAEIGFSPNVDANIVRQLVAEALDNGINLFDTAAAYVHSEQLLGEAIKSHRNEIFLVSKCGAIDGFSRSDWSKPGILRTIETSLRNLQTDHLDIALLHSCGHLEFLWGEAGDALVTARDKGLVRFIGYSGDNASALAAIRSGIFSVLETSVNIADQEAIDLLLPLASKTNTGVIAKRPIANVAWGKGILPETDYSHEYSVRLQKLDYPFLKSDLPLAVSTALKFTLAQEGIHSAIVGTSKPGRISQNASLLKTSHLSPEEIAKIRHIWQEVAHRTWVGQV